MWIIYLTVITFSAKIVTFASSCFFRTQDLPLAGVMLGAVCSGALCCGLCAASQHGAGASRAGQRGCALAGNLAGNVSLERGCHKADGPQWLPGVLG